MTTHRMNTAEVKPASRWSETMHQASCSCGKWGTGWTTRANTLPNLFRAHLARVVLDINTAGIREVVVDVAEQTVPRAGERWNLRRIDDPQDSIDLEVSAVVEQAGGPRLFAFGVV